MSTPLVQPAPAEMFAQKHTDRRDESKRETCESVEDEQKNALADALAERTRGYRLHVVACFWDCDCFPLSFNSK